MKLYKNTILAALPGAERREGAQQGMSEFDMACRDGFRIRTRRGILYRTTAGQIAPKHGRESFRRGVLRKRGFSKISLDLVVRF